MKGIFGILFNILLILPRSDPAHPVLSLILPILFFYVGKAINDPVYLVLGCRS
jgi:hypothetical protein